MSPIEKRSAGFTFNERELAKEVANGVSGYDTEQYNAEDIEYDLRAVARYQMLEELADIEVDYMLAQMQDAASGERAADHELAGRRVDARDYLGHVALAA